MRSYATPAGVYSILYTEPDSKLIGEKDPETGKPVYETYVRYWMPFTYQGHGFHDADWQTAFGGSRYQSYGSHGCVNMPVDQAELYLICLARERRLFFIINVNDKT